eukprot:4153163-Lingulodinium_polyedra.AAC.1
MDGREQRNIEHLIETYHVEAFSWALDLEFADKILCRKKIAFATSCRARYEKFGSRLSKVIE